MVSRGCCNQDKINTSCLRVRTLFHVIMVKTSFWSVLTAVLWNSYISAQDTLALEDTCCDKIFLSSNDVIARNQGGLLGIFNLSGIHNDAFYFQRQIQGIVVYFYYEKSGALGSPGWTLGTSLNSTSLYVSTRETSARFAKCPVGIKQAYDRDQTLDKTFSVQCHSDHVRQDCCFSVHVNASDPAGPVQTSFLLFLGKYDLHGSFNGYPLYYKKEWGFETFLFFRKRGIFQSDGWVLSNALGSGFSVTTRSQSNCPDGISIGYDQDVTPDTSFSITCDSHVKEIDHSTTAIMPMEEEETMETATLTIIDNFYTGDNLSLDLASSVAYPVQPVFKLIGMTVMILYMCM